jgi:hypothetical protein
MKMIKVFNGNNNSFTVIIANKPYSVDKTHPNYNVLLKAFHEDDEEGFLEHVNPKRNLEKYVVNTGIEVTDDAVTYNGKPLHGTLVDILLDYKRNNHKIDSLVAFLNNLEQNPSATSRRELYDFISHRGMPITEDGCFISYKSVQSDFYSKTGGNLKLLQGKVNAQGQIYNGVGEVIECERREVDDDREHECSYGLHTGAYGYAGHGGWFNNSGDKVVLTKTNPKDVVSVPKDHNSSKLRTCKYEVISECEGRLDNTVYNKADTFTAQSGYSTNEVSSVLQSYNKVDDTPDEDDEEDVCSDCDSPYAYCDCDSEYDEDPYDDEYYDDEDEDEDEDF